MLARWISDFDCELATQFWYIIRTGSYEIEQLSKSTRKHIRQAFKKCYVRKIEDNEIEKMYSCYQAAYKRYEKADNFRSFESIKDEFLNRKNKNMFYYGAFELETNSLIVFFICTCYTETRKENEYVYGVHGSVVILRKECIDKFLEDSIQIFMYGEELYIAEKLKENQFLSYYDKNLKIIHNENQSTGKIASQRKQKWCSQSINFLVERYWK